jgi:soluble lytic murein transglycosylase-like protein
MRIVQCPNIVRAGAVLMLAWLSMGAATIEKADEEGSAVFSDGSRAQLRRVFTYKQEDGVPVFTDKVPLNQKYEVMEFACYACDPRSRVDWRATALHTDKYADLIASAARDYEVEASLIRAIIHAESGFNPFARSHKGATGLMQLMPGTAADMGVVDINAVEDNIEGGVKYLAMLLAQYKGDVRLATAAYNSGPANVDKYGGVPPFEETQTYVERVKILHERYKAVG